MLPRWSLGSKHLMQRSSFRILHPQQRLSRLPSFALSLPLSPLFHFFCFSSPHPHGFSFPLSRVVCGGLTLLPTLFHLPSNKVVAAERSRGRRISTMAQMRRGCFLVLRWKNKPFNVPSLGAVNVPLGTSDKSLTGLHGRRRG